MDIESNKDPVRDRILGSARSKMLQFGYRKVTLDDIAKDLKVAKKTIYKYFSSKEKIAEVIFEQLKERIKTEQSQIEKASKDPLKVISETTLFIQKELSPWFHPFMNDIEVELPGLWKDFVGFRSKQIMEMENLIKSAVKKRIFRSVNPSIAVRAYLGAVDNVIDPEYLEQQGLSFSDAIGEVMDIWSNGVIRGKK